MDGEGGRGLTPGAIRVGGVVDGVCWVAQAQAHALGLHAHAQRSALRFEARADSEGRWARARLLITPGCLGLSVGRSTTTIHTAFTRVPSPITPFLFSDLLISPGFLIPSTTQLPLSITFPVSHSRASLRLPSMPSRHLVCFRSFGGIPCGIHPSQLSFPCAATRYR